MHHSDLEDQDGQGEEHALERFKDDMASRRISTHIPAPLRKKRNEDHRKFITPTGNPVAYLQKHMRSKSLSDLSEEKKEEEKNRAAINMRYEEIEKVKALLKEDEDTWTSKLQSWKKRRRSVTEDARKRKQERDNLEKEAETKSGRRRTKTYKEIVEEKMKRDKELAQLNDRDEYEFVSPRSSTSGTELPAQPIIKSTSQDLGHIPSTKTHNESMTSPALQDTDPLPKKNTYSRVMESSVSQESRSDPAVQYKYTTKVTAVINSPQKRTEYENQQSTSSVTITHPISQSKMFSSVSNEPSAKIVSTAIGSQKLGDPTHQSHNTAKASAPQIQQQTNSNIPRVLLRSKQPDARRERPKSAHDLPSGSHTLPRSFRDYSTPKPFVPGAANFMQYRRAAFASRRDMWENMSVPTGRPASAKDAPSDHARNSSDEVFASDSFIQKPDIQSHPQPTTDQSSRRSPEALEDGIPKISQRMKMLEKQNSKENPQHFEGSRGPHPQKVPLISDSQIHLRRQPATPSRTQPVSETGLTATLSTNGLSMTSPRISKVSLDITSPKKTEAFFDDMKICINQRPRSEKGFGFTVRGGDDGKPVIVDTVSPGGAADICHLCVSDEILAINEVSLSDCKTQEDIVHLIVSSVITGNLSLNIRRYGKTKKTSPLRLSGTKVVMTPGGFVQVRSDKPAFQNAPSKTSGTSVFQRKAHTQNELHTDSNNNDAKRRVNAGGGEDLPPPPTLEELDAISTYSAKRQSPLSNLIAAASHNSDSEKSTPRKSIDSDVSETSFKGTALSEVYSSKSYQQDDEDELEWEVSEAQKALDFEPVQLPDRHDEELRLKLEEEQRRLELEEAQREEIRRKIQEEARLEDMKVQEELRKIQARKLKHQSERRKEMESLQKDHKLTSAPSQYESRGFRPNGTRQSTGATHWMVEEAERRRVAEEQGKARMSALDYGKRQPESLSRSALPARVIQHLTRATKPTGPRPFVRNMVGSSSNV